MQDVRPQRGVWSGGTGLPVGLHGKWQGNYNGFRKSIKGKKLAGMCPLSPERNWQGWEALQEIGKDLIPGDGEWIKPELRVVKKLSHF